MREVAKTLLSTLLIPVFWMHALLKPIGEWFSVSVLGAFEEITKSVVRGWFATGGRYVHQVAAFIISIASRKPYARSQKRKAAARKTAWENWWSDPKGTFNAIVEQELGTSSQPTAAPPAAEGNEKKPAPPPLPKLKLKNGHHHASTTAATRISKATTKPRPPAWQIWRRASSEQELNFSNRGNTLFGTASVTPLTQRRGLVEDTRLAVEVGIAKIFAYIRKITRKIFFLETHIPFSPRFQSTKEGALGSSSSGGFSTARRTSTRRNPGKAWEDLHVFTASDAILRAGYPLEEHSVTTSDGYVLQMHRIPRRGARDVVFMMHGVLDTSLGWVAGGAGGSAALQAYDAGFDVWLANTRSNPPRLNTNPKKKGSRYWHYTANELAMCDVTAQISHIHAAKVAELAAPGVAAGKAAGTVRRSFEGGVSAGASGGGGGGGMLRSATEACLGVAAGLDGTDAITDNDDEISLMVMDNRGNTTAAADADHHAAPLRRTQSASLEDSAEDLPGFSDFTFLHKRKGENLRRDSGHSLSQSSSAEILPYRLQAVGHSLGAALLLMYVVGSSMKHQPHRIRRLILLSPAGFHTKIPLAVRPCTWLMPLATKCLNFIRPGAGMGLRLPSPVLRWFTFKLLADVNRSPALLDLMKAGLSLATSGDTSEWTAAISLPHYAPQSMPAISLHSANHFAQWANDGNFRFYDYGSARKNQAHYGENKSKPPSVSDNYWRLADSDIPVDLAAGSSDGLIPAENVKCHLERLQNAGVRCTLRGFDYGHLDFTFGVKEEVIGYIIQKLRKSAWGGRDS